LTDSRLHRERTVPAEVIILRRVDLREMDRIFVVLSDRFGKLSMIAKGVRRPTARAASHLELFSRARVMLARGRDLEIVTAAEALDLHINLRSDLNAMATASHLTELVDQFLPEHEDAKITYRNLSTALHALDQGCDPSRVARWFEMQLLMVAGIRPELQECVVCGRQVTAEPNAFNPQLGGVVCGDHAASSGATILLSVGAQKVLRLLVREDLAAYLRLAAAPGVDAELESALTAFLKFHLERDLRSLRVMRRVEESIPVWSSAYK